MLLRILAAAAFLAALAGCATPPAPIPQDGAMSRQITWVITDDPQQSCDQVSGGRRTVMPFKTLGCSSWKDARNCVIYLKAPRDEYDRRAIETLGHEVLHCFAGHFHRPLN
jgi:hypothetical protein